MKLDLPTDKDDEPDLTPMVDVVFLLIIFFMIVAQVITEEKRQVRIPIAEYSKIPEDPGRRQTITVMDNGLIFAGLQQVAPEQIEDLARTGREIHGADFKIFLRADVDTQYKDVQEVMQKAAAGGVFNIIFAVYQSDK